jgi:anti-anti-sigma regulatory factor
MKWKFSLLPLQPDALLRVRCDGPLTQLGRTDPLQEFLGGHCYSRPLLMSLERLHAIDTSGVSWLMRCQRTFEEAGGKLVLFGLTPVIADILRFLRLLPLLNIARDERAASAMALAPRLLTMPEDADTTSADSQLRSAG